MRRATVAAGASRSRRSAGPAAAGLRHGTRQPPAGALSMAAQKTCTTIGIRPFPPARSYLRSDEWPAEGAASPAGPVQLSSPVRRYWLWLGHVATLCHANEDPRQECAAG
jgi:hypothetical protein